MVVSYGGKSVIGKFVLFLGVVISAAIFAIALIGAPAGGSLAAREVQPVAAIGCHVEEFALDEGYGVTRKIDRHVCPGLN
jgi:hypothetical protein